MDISIDDEEEIEVTEEILSFHSNVRENIVSTQSSSWFLLSNCVNSFMNNKGRSVITLNPRHFHPFILSLTVDIPYLHKLLSILHIILQ